jgi:LacI family transcriptional regulator
MLSAMLASRPRPTAVVAANDGMAFAICHACREQGVRVPEDLSVVGFDDVPEAVSEGLTTLRRPYDGLGRLAADMALLAGRPPNARCRGRVGVEPDLVVRRSTCPPLDGRPRARRKARGGRRRPG